MKTRLYLAMMKGAAILLVGCAYSVWVVSTGTGIPCVFHRITGLQCPGCGVSRMLLALARLDFASAWEHNAVLLCLLPVLLGMGIRSLVRWIRTGKNRQSRGERIADICLIAVLLAWGIIRNL